jgi:hypothetical protein
MIIDADKIGHSVILDKEIYFKIVEAFGHDILNKDGTINRKKLGAVVFSSPADLQFLNSITHPVIEDRIMKTLKEWETSVNVAVIDAALLIEAGMTKLVDKVIYDTSSIYEHYWTKRLKFHPFIYRISCSARNIRHKSYLLSSNGIYKAGFPNIPPSKYSYVQSTASRRCIHIFLPPSFRNIDPVHPLRYVSIYPLFPFAQPH